MERIGHEYGMYAIIEKGCLILQKVSCQALAAQPITDACEMNPWDLTEARARVKTKDRLLHFNVARFLLLVIQFTPDRTKDTGNPVLAVPRESAFCPEN